MVMLLEPVSQMPLQKTIIPVSIILLRKKTFTHFANVKNFVALCTMQINFGNYVIVHIS